MKWGDFIDDTGGSTADVLHDLDLMFQQAKESVPLLEGFNPAKPFRIMWTIEEI
jgi:hypothetical protein